MNGDKWTRIDRTLHSALALRKHEREAFVRDACKDDDGVRDEVLSLLKHAESADGFLETRSVREPLVSGFRLGEYEIESQLGAGGMGEVYRARDLRLKRDVALKILPPDAADPERRRRFTREAQAVAALNHPGIVTIHSVEESGGIQFLTMELVEGKTLDALIPPAGLAIDKFLEIAVPLADAVGAAHARGIIHRDLKPSNVMVTSDGRVKVLDFGLAKLIEPVQPEVSHAAAKSTQTVDGRILGTLAYMSPEQAEGKAVDHRSDVFSLGVVLHELATGQRPAAATDITANLPPELSRPIKKCLAKDPARRYQSALDLRNDLEDLAPRGSPEPRGRFAWIVPLGAVAVAAVAIAYFIWPTNQALAPAQPQQMNRLTVPPPSGGVVPKQSATPLVAISPDGNWVAFHAGNPDPDKSGLFIRSMSVLEPRLIHHEVNASPFFSPDSRWLGFWSDGAIWKVPVTGGEFQKICAWPSATRGVSWGDDGNIVVASGDNGALYRVPADGGVPMRITVEVPVDARQFFPQVLPGSRAAIVTLIRENTVAVVSLEDGAVIRRLFPGSSARVAGGWMAFRRDSSLYVVGFDSNRFEAIGDPRRTSEKVDYNIGGSQTSAFDVAASGALFYMPALPRVAEAQLVWLDRQGRTEAVAPEIQDYDRPVFDPAGRRIAVHIATDGQSDLWIYDAKGWMRRTNGLNTIGEIVWTPDGEWIVFSARTGQGPQLYRVPSREGPAEELTSVAEYGAFKHAYDVATSVHENQVMFHRQVGPVEFDLLTMPLSPKATPKRYLGDKSEYSFARISPDGRFVAYQSTELEDRRQVMLRPYTNPERYRMTVAAPGVWPQWSRDGRLLFYRRGRVIWQRAVVPGNGDAQPRLGNAEKVVDTGDIEMDQLTSFDPSPDGKRFLIVKRPTPPRSEGLLVYIADWLAAVTQRSNSPVR